MSSLKFCANLSFMFQETPSLLERYALASKVGFKAVETAFPYVHPVEEVVKAKEAAGVEQVLINVFVGDVTNGELGFAAVPGKEDAFEASINRAVQYAKALNCKKIHVMSGLAQHPTVTHFETYEKNMLWATRVFELEGILGLIEPINQRSVPHYFMNSYTDAVNVVKKVNSPNLKIMLDVFHLQQLHGNLTSNIEQLVKDDLVGHVQIAQVPLRNEPDTPGEINFHYIFSLLEKVGYSGWIGLEYKPQDMTEAGLKWMKKYSVSL